MNNSPHEFKLFTRLDGDHPDIIWEALQEIGVDPQSPHTTIKQRFCTTQHLQGVPMELVALLPEKIFRSRWALRINW